MVSHFVRQLRAPSLSGQLVKNDSTSAEHLFEGNVDDAMRATPLEQVVAVQNKRDP